MSSFRNLLLTCSLFTASVSAQLFVYPPPSRCTQCTIPFKVDLPECESPYLSECYCQNFRSSGEEISGMYVTPMLECARSNCSVEEVDDLKNYYSGLCSPPASLQSGGVEFSNLLTTSETAAEGRLSKTCSTCLTTFTTNTFNHCTPSDLSSCLCTSDTLDPDGTDTFVLDCPCSASAQRAALLSDDTHLKIVAPPAMQLLECLRGPSCSGTDKALLARWGERRCEKGLFTGEKMYRGEWERKETAGGRLKVQRVRKRDRMGSMSSWGADDGFAAKAGVGKDLGEGAIWIVGLTVAVGLGGVL